MKALAMLPFWFFVAAIAFPLVLISLAAIVSTLDAARMQRQVNDDPIVFSSNTVWFGPFTIATNVRGWAGVCVIVGIALTSVGLVGLLHFPTPIPQQIAVHTQQHDGSIK